MDKKTTKELIKENIYKNPRDFLYYPEFFDDKEIVSVVINKRPSYYEYISERLKSDKDIIKTLLSRKPATQDIYKVPEIYTDNEDFMLEVAQISPYHALSYSSNRLKDNFNFVRKIINSDSNALTYASKRLKDNKIIVLEASAKKEQSVTSMSVRMNHFIDKL